MREFALSIGKKNFFTYGEVLDSRSEQDIARFIGRDTTVGQGDDQVVGVDAALDYPLFFAARDVLKRLRAPEPAGRHVPGPKGSGARHRQLCTATRLASS